MRVALHNVKTLHKKIDLRKQQRLEDALASASDALQGKFSRYRDRIDGGKLLHWQAIAFAGKTGSKNRFSVSMQLPLTTSGAALARSLRWLDRLEPDINHLNDYIFTGDSLVMDLKEIWVFDRVSGKVYSKSKR